MKARAAPAVFPMPFHRSLDIVDHEERVSENRRAGWAKRRALACGKAQESLHVPALFAMENAGQKGVCTANPALTIDANTEREAMALSIPAARGKQPDSGGAL